MHMSIPIALTGALGLLTSCTTGGDVKVPTAAETVSSDKALAFPPPGGPAIVNVVERRFGNGVEQDIALFTSASTPGQNFLKVKFVGPSGSGQDGEKALGFSPIRETVIAREIRSALPGIRATKSGNYLQNTYGPFSYASGTNDRDETCIYAWQQIRSRESTRSAARNYGLIQIRLRLCDQHATEQALLGVMYGYTIAGSFNGVSWNPYDLPQGVNQGLGRPGTSIYPEGMQDNRDTPPIGYDPAITSAVRLRPARSPIVPVKAAVAPTPVVLVPTGPLVPLPQVATPATVSSVIVPPPTCVTTATGACP